MKAIDYLENLKYNINKEYFDLYKKAIKESNNNTILFNKLMKKYREMYLKNETYEEI
jgi:hypothetical protein